jgi:hypothetical protein
MITMPMDFAGALSGNGAGSPARRGGCRSLRILAGTGAPFHAILCRAHLAAATIYALVIFCVLFTLAIWVRISLAPGGSSRASGLDRPRAHQPQLVYGRPHQD